MSNTTPVSVETHAEIVQDIIRFFKTDIVNDPAFEISPSDRIISKGLIDSMGIIRLMTHLQKIYAIKDFDNRDLTLDNFQSIERIAAMMAKYR